MNQNIHTLARAVIIQEDHILLIYDIRSSPRYTFLPGGHIEYGEGCREALKRELLEEVGMEFGIGRFLGCLEASFIPEVNKVFCHTHEYNFIFLVPTSTQDINVMPFVEPNLRFVWHSIKSLSESLIMPSSLIRLIPDWLRENHHNSFHSQMQKNLLKTTKKYF